MRIGGQADARMGPTARPGTARELSITPGQAGNGRCRQKFVPKTPRFRSRAGSGGSPDLRWSYSRQPLYHVMTYQILKADITLFK